ncbi:DCC-interacting protein 13-alpha, partial [Tupaia chinensis]
QTRSLLGVFEEDATAISNYMNQLYQAMHRIYDAQRFPLGGDDEVMSSTLQQFSKVIDELSSCHAVLSTQLADAMMFPITQFKERDLKDHDAAINRYSRLSKKRENDKVKYEVTEDVYTSRKKQHQTMMHYFCALNTLQYKKKIALLEPLLGYMQAQISFFKMGSENLSEQLEEFLANIGTSVQKEMDNDVETMQQTIEDLEVASDPLYVPDPDPTKFPVNRNLTRKAGYLNARNKTGLVSSTWDRQFYFTQGGNLMSQARGDVAGGLAMDIDNCSVMAVDCEDRRYCFQITSFDGKKQTRPPTARTSSSGSLGSESTNLAALSLDSLVAPDTPIQFDIISPVSEDQPGQAKASGQGGRRTNPFGESGGVTKSETEDSILHQLFIVRFLGSMEVKSDDHPDVVYETMRQILAARAIHNIFRMTESHLLVTCDCLKLIDPQTQVTRLTDRRATEKQKEIERVKEKQQKELSKQKQIEKDLEEQSRLIAASNRPNQTSGEGQFVVLSSSQSEESDLGEEGKKRESEA